MYKRKRSIPVKNLKIEKDKTVKDLSEFIAHVRVKQQVKLNIRCDLKNGVKIRLETSHPSLKIQNNITIVKNHLARFENLRFDRSSGRGF